MNERETVGKISSDLAQKEPESRDPIELERSMQKEYYKYLVDCIEVNKSRYTDQFFIVVITKNERLMPNVFRNYFYARKSCPTPDYDQTVWRYDNKADELEYLWTIPSRESCKHLKLNAIYVPKEERQLLQFVLEFADGTLFKVAKYYNNEQPDSPLLKAES